MNNHSNSVACSPLITKNNKMKLLYILVFVCFFANEAISDSFVCISSKLQTIGNNKTSTLTCDNEIEHYFMHDQKPIHAKQSCKQYLKNFHVYKLKIQQDTMVLNNGHRDIELSKKKYQDGIIGLSQWREQWQTVANFVPLKQQLFVTSINSYAGVTTAISDCYKN